MITASQAAIRATEIEDRIAATLPAGCDVYLSINRDPRAEDQRPSLRILCPDDDAAGTAEACMVSMDLEDVAGYGVPAASPAGRRGYVRKVVGYVSEADQKGEES